MVLMRGRTPDDGVGAEHHAAEGEAARGPPREDELPEGDCLEQLVLRARTGERDETCPVSTEGWTRRVHFIREGGGDGGARARA